MNQQVPDSDGREPSSLGLGSPVPGDPEAPEVGETGIGDGVICTRYESEGGGDDIIRNAPVTTSELEYVARHWHEIDQAVEDDFVFLGQASSRDNSYAMYACSRIDSLWPLLSQEFKNELQQDAEKRGAERDAHMELSKEEREFWYHVEPVKAAISTAIKYISGIGGGLAEPVRSQVEEALRNLHAAEEVVKQWTPEDLPRLLSARETYPTATPSSDVPREDDNDAIPY